MGGSQFTSLDAATATGLGDDLHFGLPKTKHSLQVIHTGTPTAVKVTLLGSNDGTNYTIIGTWDSADGHVSTDMIFVDGAPVTHVKANLVTLTAGTDPTVTAIITSSD